MKESILVTDTLFIAEDHVKTLEAAGYEVARAEKPDMSEGELCEAVKGKVGYILGGIEYVTEAVIDAATELKVIIFTGTGYKGHIPAWEYARKKGILIANTPYANVYEVAEWGIAATLAMQRDLFALGPQGTDKFHTITSLPDLSVGIIGMGHIGKQYADMISSLGAKEVAYWNRSEKRLPYAAKAKEAILAESDIIFVALGDEAGDGFINQRELDLMKPDALLVSIAHNGIVDEQALSDCIKQGKIRAAMDIIGKRDLFQGLSPERWYASNASAAYNSRGYLRRSSDMATQTMLNLLATGQDKYLIA